MNTAIAWILRIIPAVIMAQSLPFKFSGAAESKALFSTLTEKALGNQELEAVARLGTGTVELIAIMLLLIPKTRLYGALLTMGTMAGALASHVAFLGFSGSHGQLAAMAGIALVSATIYLVLLRRDK